MKKIFCKKRKVLFLSTMLILSNAVYGINVIFDLGEVLISTKKMYIMRQVGIYSFLMFLLRLNNPFALRKRLFATLEQIPAISQNEFGATDDNGKPLPNIMCDWLTGTKTSKEILEEINELFSNNPDFFHNRAEKNILNKMTSIMFTPKRFTKSRSIIKKGIKFVKRCKKKGHNVFILSNWDPESFEYILKAFPKLFSLFEKDHITISGDIGIIKPNPQIYEYILAKHNLDPQECIFFDDQEVNIKAAEAFGIHGVVCKNIRYKKMVQALDSFLEEFETEIREINETNTISV